MKSKIFLPQSEPHVLRQFSRMGVSVIGAAMVAEVMAIIGEHGEV